MTSEGYAAIPNWMIRDPGFSIYAIAVYGALASYTGKGEIYPSHETLAVMSRCSERKVREALNELRAAGVVSWRRRELEGRGRSSNGYTLHPNGSPELTAPDADRTVLPAPGVRSTGTQRQFLPAPGAEEEEPVKELKNVEAPPRGDVSDLCLTLVDLIEANGSRRPGVNKAWNDAARLLLDVDQRRLDEALTIMRWCQADPFWRSNILSMPKFRAKYDQLRLASERDKKLHAAVAQPKIMSIEEMNARRDAVMDREKSGGWS